MCLSMNIGKPFEVVAPYVTYISIVWTEEIYISAQSLIFIQTINVHVC